MTLLRWAPFYLFLSLPLALELSAQQIIDSTFTFTPNAPAYPQNEGPVIHIDEYHNNDMSITNGMYPLIDLLKKDGYRPTHFKERISPSSLKEVEIFVIIGALHQTNVDNWILPTPEALGDDEIETLINWVEQGGKLLLVADHMPFPGAIKKLSTRLGVEWYNGFVIDSVNWGMSIFAKKEGTLANHAILNGRGPNEVINSVATYYGSGFKIVDHSITGLLGFNNPDIVSYQTQEAWRMSDDTPIVPSFDLYQAAIRKQGMGKVALVGEASLFSAQLVGKTQDPVGLNYPNGNQNLQFTLNLFHWLSGVLD